MLVMKEERDSGRVLTKWVGRGSSRQVDDLNFQMSSDISVTVGSWKLDNREEGGAEEGLDMKL